MKYKVTKKFLVGYLVGMEFTEETSVYFETGRIYSECLGTGTYVVTAIERIA